MIHDPTWIVENWRRLYCLHASIPLNWKGEREVKKIENEPYCDNKKSFFIFFLSLPCRNTLSFSPLKATVNSPLYYFHLSYFYWLLTSCLASWVLTFCYMVGFFHHEWLRMRNQGCQPLKMPCDLYFLVIHNYEIMYGIHPWIYMNDFVWLLSSHGGPITLGQRISKRIIGPWKPSTINVLVATPRLAKIFVAILVWHY